VSPETSQRQAPGPMSPVLIQRRTPCHALVQRRHLQSHHASTQGGDAARKTCCGLQRGEQWGRTRRPAHRVSTRSEERGASVLRGIGSRARMPRSRRRRHRRFDSGRLRIVRRAGTPFARRQSPGGLPPRGVAVTMVFPDITRMSGGCDARARSSRADPRQSRKPSLPRGLLVHLCRQTASARATGHGEPVAIGSPA